MKKKLSTIAMAALALSLLAGCGNTDGEKAEEKDGSVENSVSVEEKTEEKETAGGEETAESEAENEAVSEEKGVDVLLLYTRYYFDDGTLAESTENVYDEKGVLTESIVSSYGEESRCGYKYDENGNRTECIIYGEDNETIESRTEYKYDENGNEIEIIYYWGNEISGHWEQDYDDNGNQIECRTYSSTGELEEKTEYKYDENGVLTEKVQHNERLSINYTNKYDSHGNITESINYKQGTGEIETTEINEYDYDTYGNMTKRVYSRNDRIDYKYDYTYIYDDNGNILKETEHVVWEGRIPALDVERVFEYTYDENGNCVEEIYYDENGGIIGKTVFTYDENGNRTKLAGYTCIDGEYVLAEESEWRVIYR